MEGGRRQSAQGRGRAAGEVVIAENAYGLTARLRWPASDRFPSPLALGEPIRGDGPWRPAPAGVSAPAFGWLDLHNAGSHALRIGIECLDALRAWRRVMDLAAGATAQVPVDRRRALSAGKVSDLRAVGVDLTVRPVEADRSVGPDVRVRLVDDSAADTGLVLCPPDETVSMDLESHMPPHAWKLPVPVSGAAGGAVRLRPVGSEDAGWGLEIPPAAKNDPTDRRDPLLRHELARFPDWIHRVLTPLAEGWDWGRFVRLHDLAQTLRRNLGEVLGGVFLNQLCDPLLGAWLLVSDAAGLFCP